MYKEKNTGLQVAVLFCFLTKATSILLILNSNEKIK